MGIYYKLVNYINKFIENSDIVSLPNTDVTGDTAYETDIYLWKQ